VFARGVGGVVGAAWGLLVWLGKQDSNSPASPS
jgi:hypothetical protein